jgi:acetoin utilization deacetylase AcuC-like enzyme
MKVVFTEEQKAHYPEYFLVNGVMRTNPEVPERCDRLLDGALRAGCRHEAPQEYGLEVIGNIHPQRYLRFLENAFTRWSRIEGGANAVTPNVQPRGLLGGYPESVVAQAGFHMADLACPLSAGSWGSICWSAWTAAHAARQIMQGDEAAYALCRPPGHHASAEIAGGFCYLNNTAIASQMLLEQFRRVAILDVDLHHGNGTQEIFYRRNDVLTVSIHADPARFYPFFGGYAHEKGQGSGAGFNLNLPLPRGSGDEVFMQALEQALDRIGEFGPGALVIALGLDAFEKDPFAGLSVSTAGFGKIGREISARVNLPTLIVQEGGYLCDELGDNLAAFLKAL